MDYKSARRESRETVQHFIAVVNINSQLNNFSPAKTIMVASCIEPHAYCKHTSQSPTLLTTHRLPWTQVYMHASMFPNINRGI